MATAKTNTPPKGNGSESNATKSGTSPETASPVNYPFVKSRSLAERLFAAQQEVEPLKHDSRSREGGYSYTSAETVIDMARQILARQGLMVYRSKWSVEEPSPAAGSTGFVLVTSFFHVEAMGNPKEGLDMEVIHAATGHHGMPLDKAIAAALTVSLSYFLRDLLLIPRGHTALEETPDEGPANPAAAATPTVDKAREAIIRCGNLQTLEVISQRIQEHPDIQAEDKQRLLALADTRGDVLRTASTMEETA